MSDDCLLAAYRQGDHEAYTILVGRYYPAVQVACQRQVTGAEVDDCVQAVWLVLARRPAAAAGAQSLLAWLLTVAWHVCQRSKRQQRRRLRRERVVDVVDVAAPETAATA